VKTILSSNVIGIDTETTGVGRYDVPVGVSVSDGRDSFYGAWGHQNGENNMTLPEVAGLLNDMDSGKTIIMHNAIFDLRMLRAVGVDLMGRHEIVDTSYLAAVLNPYELDYSLGGLAKKFLGEEKPDDELNQRCADAFGGKPKRSAISKGNQVGQAQNYWKAPGTWVREYAEWDAWATYQLWAALWPQIEAAGLGPILALEHAQIPILVRMFETGVRANVEKAEHEYGRIRSELHVLHDEWDRAYDIPLSGPGSKNGLHALWESEGLPFATTKKGNPSIPQSLVNQYAGQSNVARLLKEIRPREKFSTTFLKGYIIDAHERGRIHPSFHPLRGSFGGTVSGRYSSSKPNLQNPPSPKRDREDDPAQQQYGHLFRSMFLPDKGQVWLSADYSQIEYRFFAHYAGGNIRQAFIDNPDIDFHQWCADKAGVPRSDAKNGNFAKLYGAGVGRLASTLGISKAEAERFIAEYDRAIPEAASLYQRAVFKAEQRGYVMTWGGRRSLFPYYRGRYIKTHAALNYLLQGSAADLIKKAMIAVDQAIDWDECKLLLTVHDELNLTCPPGSPWPAIVKEAMEDFELTVPVMTDVEVGENWGYLEAI
jgi:DNA polymerase-1